MKKIGMMFLCLFVFSLTACQQNDKMMDTFIGTPHIFIAKDGMITTSLSPDTSEDNGHPVYFESTEDFDKLINENNLLDKNKQKGEYINISYAEFLSMLDKKESFIAIVTQTGCGHCKNFKEGVLDSYIEENGVKVYEINITLEESPKTVFDALKEFIKTEK